MGYLLVCAGVITSGICATVTSIFNSNKTAKGMFVVLLAVGVLLITAGISQMV